MMRRTLIALVAVGALLATASSAAAAPPDDTQDDPLYCGRIVDGDFVTSQPVCGFPVNVFQCPENEGGSMIWVGSQEVCVLGAAVQYGVQVDPCSDADETGVGVNVEGAGGTVCLDPTPD